MTIPNTMHPKYYLYWLKHLTDDEFESEKIRSAKSTYKGPTPEYEAVKRSMLKDEDAERKDREARRDKPEYLNDVTFRTKKGRRVIAWVSGVKGNRVKVHPKFMQVGVGPLHEHFGECDGRPDCGCVPHYVEYKEISFWPRVIKARWISVTEIETIDKHECPLPSIQESMDADQWTDFLLPETQKDRDELEQMRADRLAKYPWMRTEP